MGLTYFVAAIAAVTAQFYLSPIPEVSTINVLKIYSTSNLLLFTSLIISHPAPISTFIAINTVFICTSTTLTLARRLYFSPLSRFPGPKHLALTNLFKAHIYFTGQGNTAILALHKQYNSDIIRIGPNELGIIDVDAIDKVFKGKYPRGVFYEVGAINGEVNLNTARDYKLHTPWRRIWERAFASKEFVDYNPRVEVHVKKLGRVVKASQGRDVDVTKLMGNLVFDIMADLSFAHDSNMQEGEGDGFYMGFIHKYIAMVGLIGALRPLCQLLPHLPENSEVREFRLRGEALLAERQKLGSTRRDLFRHLLAEDEETELKFTQAQLNSNANLVIVAGADTASSALTQIFRVLAKDKKVATKLKKEIDDTVSEVGELNVENTKALPYLNAVINEGLRLMNPVPTGVHAATPPGGLTISGTYIPGNVQVIIPHQGIMTDERYFARGLEFIPERWTDDWKEGVKDRRAYIPFGYGVHSCVGKQLALNEMRLVIASVVSDFDVVLAERYDEKTWKEGLKDHAVMKIGELWLKFVPRK